MQPILPTKRHGNRNKKVWKPQPKRQEAYTKRRGNRSDGVGTAAKRRGDRHQHVIGP